MGGTSRRIPKGKQWARKKDDIQLPSAFAHPEHKRNNCDNADSLKEGPGRETKSHLLMDGEVGGTLPIILSWNLWHTGGRKSDREIDYTNIKCNLASS